MSAGILACGEKKTKDWRRSVQAERTTAVCRQWLAAEVDEAVVAFADDG
jgi:hypothetical protein